MDGSVAVVSHLQNPVAGQRSLNAEIPGLRVRLFDIGGKPAEARGSVKREARKWRARLIHRGRKRERRQWIAIQRRIASQHYGAGSEINTGSGSIALIIESAIIRSAVPEELLRRYPAAQRVTGADDSAISA